MKSERYAAGEKSRESRNGERRTITYRIRVIAANERIAAHRSRLSLRRTARSGRSARSRAAYLLAAHAAAVRARSHQPVVAEGRRELHANRLRLRRRDDTRALGTALRDDARATADHANRRDALPSR